MFIKYCVFFLTIVKTLQTLPCQYWAVIGRSENDQPIGVTVHFYEFNKHSVPHLQPQNWQALSLHHLLHFLMVVVKGWSVFEATTSPSLSSLLTNWTNRVFTKYCVFFEDFKKYS